MSRPQLDSSTTADELVSHYASRIAGKVILTTGISPGGIGAYFVQVVAKAQPSWIILAGRDPKKAQATESSIVASNPGVKVRFLKVDLESLQSVRDAAAEVNSWSDIPAIDVVVNNAGVMDYEYRLTVDGFERHLAANYLGHFLLNNLIMGKILASNSPRVVNIASKGHRANPFRFIDYNFDGGKTYNALRAYGQSKSASMLMAVSLAEKLGERGLLSFSLHPGGILTNMVSRLDFTKFLQDVAEVDRIIGNDEAFVRQDWGMKSIEQGTATHVYAAFDPDLADHNSAYLMDCQVVDPFKETVKSWATSPVEAEKLWRLSEELVGQKFSY